MSSQDKQKSFFTNLWERRFFQFFATYVAASWGAIQFLEWGVKRYSIPSAWVDKLVVFLLVMLPLVLCVIYFHGKPGADRWLKFEKVFYPINVVVALMMSMFLVNSSAGSITEEVTVTDVEGQTIVREVPKQEFNKRVVVFPTEGASEESEWVGVGLSELLNNKLEQDMRIMISSAMSISDSYEDYGYKPFEDIPFATKMNISVDNYSDFFVDSKFISGTNDKVEVKVFETITGEEIAQEIVEGSDIYSLTENISEIVNAEIKLSEVEGKELYIDLPAINLITDDTSALRIFIESRILLSKEPSKINEVKELLNKSVEKDPKCAECWAGISMMQLMSGKDQTNEMTNALKYAESLPERQQLNIKFLNYLTKNDSDKAMKLSMMWRKLYPHDTKPVQNLIRIYSSLLRIEDAKKVAKEAIEDGHKGSIYLTYANFLIQTKDWEQAEVYLKKYKETYPKQFEATSLLVDTYAGKGQMDKALDAIDELIIMKPAEKSYLLKKAELYSRQNKFDEAIKILKEALRDSDTVSDSLANYSGQIQVFSRSMRYEEFGKCRRDLKDLFLANYPAIQYLQTEYSTVGYYKIINEPDSITFHIKDIASKVAPSRRPLVKDLNEFIIKMFSEDTVRIEESYEKIKPLFASMGNNFVTLLYDSEVKYLMGKYEEALPIFAACKEEAIDVSMVSNSYHEAHLKLGKYKEGLVIVNELLEQDPLSPIVNLYKARFLNKLNNKKESKEALGLVLKVFKDSDQRCTFTKDAIALANEFGM
jgi:tetratricopeptide (TPR) repeat protein